MIIRKLRPAQGICFAWLPAWTDEGLIWFEWLHFRWEPGWGWGSGGSYRYQRWVPEKLYEAGTRAQADNPNCSDRPTVQFAQCDDKPCKFPHCLRQTVVEKCECRS